MRLALSLILTLAIGQGMMAASASAGDLFAPKFPTRYPGIDYSTGVPFMAAPYIISKHDGGGYGYAQGHGHGHSCANCGGSHGGHGYGYAQGHSFGHGHNNGPMRFFGPGGPVVITPGYPDSAGYINVTRAPRDFFAFSPYNPNPPY